VQWNSADREKILVLGEEKFFLICERYSSNLVELIADTTDYRTSTELITDAKLARLMRNVECGIFRTGDTKMGNNNQREQNQQNREQQGGQGQQREQQNREQEGGQNERNEREERDQRNEREQREERNEREQRR
jgi:hypothetical protein